MTFSNHQFLPILGWNTTLLHSSEIIQALLCLTEWFILNTQERRSWRTLSKQTSFSTVFKLLRDILLSENNPVKNHEILQCDSLFADCFYRKIIGFFKCKVEARDNKPLLENTQFSFICLQNLIFAFLLSTGLEKHPNIFLWRTILKEHNLGNLTKLCMYLNSVNWISWY